MPDSIVQELFHKAQEAVAKARFAIATAKAAWKSRNVDALSMSIFIEADEEARKAIFEANQAVALHKSAANLESNSRK